MTRALRLSADEALNLQNRIKARPSVIQMRDQPAERQKRSQKYGNEKVEDAGRTFDSKAEHKRWQYLAMLERAGEIRDLRRQVPFELIPAQVAPDGTKVRPTVYVADFVYTDKAGKVVVEDQKGCSTPEWRLKRKLMLQVHGVWVREIRS